MFCFVEGSLYKFTQKQWAAFCAEKIKGEDIKPEDCGATNLGMVKNADEMTTSDFVSELQTALPSFRPKKDKPKRKPRKPVEKKNAEAEQPENEPVAA